MQWGKRLCGISSIYNDELLKGHIMAKNNKKMAFVYGLPNEVYFDEKTKLYIPIWNNEEMDAMEKGIIFEEIPQSTLKEIYQREKGAKQPMSKKEKPTFEGMNMDAMQYDVMAQFKNNETVAQPQEQKSIVESNNDKTKVDNTGAIKITCTMEQMRILKIFASLKHETIKNIMLDALALYYEQPQNKKAFEKAKDDLKEIY